MKSTFVTVGFALVLSGGMLAAEANCVNANKGDAAEAAACENEKKAADLASFAPSAPVLNRGERASFKVKGMHCSSCAHKITKAIEGSGLKASDIDVDVDSSRVSFTCGQKACDLAPLFKKISSIGYKASALN